MDKIYFENDMIIDSDRPNEDLFNEHVIQDHTDLISIDKLLGSIFSPENLD